MLIGVRIRLVIEIVEQSAHSPAHRIFVRREASRARLHRLLDGERVLSEGIGLRVFMQEGEGFVA